MTGDREPTAEELEAMFWSGVAGDAFAMKLMAAGAIPPDPELAERQRLTYRLTFHCGYCPEAHVVHGSFPDVVNAIQVLIGRGVNSIQVQEAAYAMERDEERTEALLDAQGGDGPPDWLASVLARKPKGGA